MNGSQSPAVDVAGLSHRYGERLALADLNLQIARGELFVLLGPNGGGKTTLFRILSTLVPPQAGACAVLGNELPREAAAVRARIGVVFQAPSLDRKLTVRENVHLQGVLYGLAGANLRRRVEQALAMFSLADRAEDRVESLSGGLKRRVELAKGLLHEPQLLLLDEPSTGVDPGARSDLWHYLKQIRAERGVTVVATTHLLEEGDQADRIGILSEGKLVALDTPEALRASLGGDTLLIESKSPSELAAGIRERFELSAGVVEGSVRLETREGHRWVSKVIEAFPGLVESVRVGKPTLEDVFIARTGHRFWAEPKTAAPRRRHGATA
jgi:ABC-2 type transport system ATP-binding protein